MPQRQIFYRKNGEVQKKDILKAKEFLLKYFDEQIEVFSPKRIGNSLKYIFSQLQKDPSIKNKKDIYYVIPNTGKSFELISVFFAKVNNVSLDKFIYYNGREQVPANIPKEATLVLLDDFVGSGQSFLEE